jgi:hypothetical protein
MKTRPCFRDQSAHPRRSSIPAKLFSAAVAVVALSVFSVGAADNFHDDKAAAEVALKFINQYADYSDSRSFKSDASWVKKCPLCTPEFGKRLEEFNTHWRKIDPIVGFGADPVVSSNGGVPATFSIKSIKVSGEQARAIALGDKSFPMQVPIKLVKRNGQWLVDGSGELAK